MEDGIMDDGGLEGCIKEMRELAKDKSPYLGMEFPSEEAAYEFYNEYGRIVGFANETGISLKASHDLISAIAGEKQFVGFTREDQKTYLCAKR
ncbi:hypothetical protein ACSBR2_029745 [Camellia fascicularis]